ncbi:MAG: response regulator transcription factor [Ignavibacteriales bacterium]|nr:response regulator transcription factor [Ignavibacteriales bacterium]
MKHVLVIEDDKDITGLLDIHLKDLNCKVTIVHDGEKGFNNIVKNKYDLVVLDVMLPKMDGLEVCRKVRAEKNNTPILMLTAKSEELDKVLGLEVGADDYLTKPFSVREFIARVKAMFRRMEAMQSETKTGDASALLSFGELEIDRDRRKVLLSGKRLDLTAKEFDLLVLFASHPGKTYTREQLLELVWGYQFNGYDHTVNSHINRLRSKIEKDMSKPKYILTAWGVGYRFAELEEIS